MVHENTGKAILSALILSMLLLMNARIVHSQTKDLKQFPASVSTPGLTLSGGGAKGLAHIGVLHILDSLGIEVKCISGTSMGSIIGGMYAAGYSAREIEEFATTIDWEILFSPRPAIDYLPPQERNRAGKSILELSVDGRKIKLPTGAIEGQQLWNTLNEIFLPVYRITDFEQLPIPFACVATNVENGMPVVMKSGNLSGAIRASMAIPSVFTAVKRDSLKLIDGGVVKNFPVSVAKDLGADFVIGVNVSQGLRTAEQLNTPVDIIYQMGFYVDALNFEKDKALADIYIEPDLTGFSAASFTSAAEIIERGKTAARNNLEQLIRLAEILNSSKQKNPEASKPDFTKVFILNNIEITGNKQTGKPFIKGRLQLLPGDTLKAADFSRAVNRLFATNNYEKINYSLTPSSDKNKVQLNLDVSEKPVNRLLLAVNFSSFNGIGLIAGWKSSKFLIDNTNAYARVLIGKNPAYEAGISAFTSYNQQSWINLTSKGFSLEFPVYENFNIVSNYRQSRVEFILAGNTITGQNSYISFGTSFFLQNLNPKILSGLTIKGHNNGFESFTSWTHHTLNRNAFPLSGKKIRLRLSVFHNQNPDLTATNYEGDAASLSELDIHINTFIQSILSWESYIPAGNKTTQLLRFQGGYNFSNDGSFINSFNVGGTSEFLSKQFLLSGINEYEIITNALISGAWGLQYHIGSNVYATGLMNALAYDFSLDKLPQATYNRNIVLGTSLSLGYLSLLGPIELTFSYSPQTDAIIGYVNLGWSF